MTIIVAKTHFHQACKKSVNGLWSACSCFMFTQGADIANIVLNKVLEHIPIPFYYILFKIGNDHIKLLILVQCLCADSVADKVEASPVQ